MRGGHIMEMKYVGIEFSVVKRGVAPDLLIDTETVALHDTFFKVVSLSCQKTWQDSRMAT
jgi:hypothetical protein